MAMMYKYKRVPVAGYEGEYDIDTNGTVFSRRFHKSLSPSKDRGGYLHVTLCKGGTRKTEKVHRLVAKAFVENELPNILTSVNHKDGNKTNNCADNLEWVTAKENTHHAIKAGLIKTKVLVCTNCGAEYKQNFNKLYPKYLCEECRTMYRAKMSLTEENKTRQKKIVSLVKQKEIPVEKLSQVTNKSVRSVKNWMHGYHSYKPEVLDVIEAELL